MKMSTDFSSPNYNTETCDAFTLALTSDKKSLFEATHTWSDVGSPNHSGFSRQTPASITIAALISNLNLLKLSSGSYSTTYTCIEASTTVNQNYDLGTKLGTTSY
jgi:hypothetical protein